MDNDVTKLSLSQGGFAVALVLLFHFYRKDLRGYVNLWKGQSEALIEVVKENTASNTQLITIIHALHRRLDRDAFDRDQPRR